MRRFALPAAAIFVIGLLALSATDAAACPACMQYLSRKLGMGFFYATMILLTLPFAGAATLFFIVRRALTEPPRVRVADPLRAPIASPASPAPVVPEPSADIAPEHRAPGFGAPRPEAI